jgi:mannose-6-phosphate isomerase-like protein (cupin superfamily)
MALLGLETGMSHIPERLEPLVIDEADAPLDGWDDPVKGRIRWRTLFSRGGTPTDGITCGVCDLAPGGWLGLHRHAPPEIYYVLAGAGVVTLEGKEVAVKAGSAVFIPGMAEHGVRQTGAGRLRFFYGFPVDSLGTIEYLFSAASAA